MNPAAKIALTDTTASAATHVIHWRPLLWENAEQNPATSPMEPLADAIRDNQTIQLTPFHAADPTVSAKTGKEDPTARNVHTTRSNGERLGTL